MKRQDALFVDGGATVINSDLVPTRRAISPSKQKEKKHWLGFNTVIVTSISYQFLAFQIPAQYFVHSR